jgi:uncharacterized protein with PIN domain
MIRRSPKVVFRTASSPHAAAEGRILLTKDGHFVATAASATWVVLIAGAGVGENVASLGSALEIDWQHAPFTRCTVDNRPLDLAPADLMARVPEGWRATGGPVRVCPDCGRLYRPGGHIRRCSSSSSNAKAPRPCATEQIAGWRFHRRPFPVPATRAAASESLVLIPFARMTRAGAIA